ncbi:MAG TPA: VOC family protein [Trichocoleus sp.]
MLRIAQLDHLVLTVNDLAATCQFYSDLGMEVITFGSGRTALQFGQQKINLHLVGAEIAPHAHCPQAGSADLCFLVETPLVDAIAHLQARGIPILLGPVLRTGAAGPVESIYLRDPDGNLVELASRLVPEDFSSDLSG